ncbi:DUF6456 domain-containing protein [Polymorphum gilvum]|uniref:ATPase involved in DNA replication initiation n=1 Tax=Polymorphum gilvum (strain LMG 25793 / CGMCC 1.9160 / SL003B-26A1) TaxID=991905 RepID=F2IV43_POLGS|nr:DUF6456 domain-containing protein [Polymorphum gilvum]ADZ71374.1 ATPase involved in DNA replication initiation [Polymorphum gilvum SL003B-26A1]
MNGPAVGAEARLHRRVLKRLATGPLLWEAGGRAPCLRDPAASADAPALDLPAGLLERLRAAGLVAGEPGGTVLLTDDGRTHLRRLLSGREDLRAQQQAQAVELVPDPVGPGRVHALVNLAESPLAWLARRRDRSGAPLIDPAAVEAGERLRADYTFAGLMPALAGGWRTEVGPGRHCRAGGGAAGDLPDHVLAARDRVRAALDAAGPGLSGVLVDVCCLLKGLETVERERGWPARSAKVVLGLALGRLADHYGYASTARGRARIRPRRRRD